MKQNKLFSTTNFETIQELCSRAQNESIMLGLIGYPGAGKTTSLKYYFEQNKNTYYTRVSKSMNAKEFWLNLLNDVGCVVNSKRITIHGLIRLLISELNTKYEKQLIIIDEAGKFKPKFLEYIHELRDETENNVGIIIGGPEYFHSNLIEWRNKGVIGIPEFYRRVYYWEFLEPLDYNEIFQFCKANNITSKKIVSQFYKSCSNFSELIYRIDAYKKSNDFKRSKSAEKVLI